ncbi:MAG: ATP-binding protein [Candidatus Dormibacteraeota bacterium]|nr:ATP-binding protein [Candidatus Dormibacteraeota bacterium]
MKLPHRTAQALAWVAALLGPALLTAMLVRVGGSEKRDYIFLYLGLVAALGVLRGLWPGLAAAAVSFLLVDYFFVPPFGTLTIADEQDVVNLLAFAATAGLVGLLGSQRRQGLLRAEALGRDLRQTNAELARLNKEQAKAAQAALTLTRSQEQIRALQEVDRSRRELLANVSHELRTPLSTILTESTAPLAKAEGLAGAEHRLRAIAGEAQRLKVLVDDMLDMAVIEAGTLELHLEPIRLADAIEAAVERLHRASGERQVLWEEAASDLDVLADWGRLGQILDNLLANADRFGPPHTPIEVRVGQGPAGLVAVCVRDHGPGVAPEVERRLFERFVHGPSDDGAVQPVGTGLGLAIVKGLVEAHAGSVELAETNDRGATFRFTLPLADPTA